MDMESVIRGLEECAGNGNCTKCQYGKEKQALSCKKLLTDALALLKELEAKIKQLNRFVTGFSRDAMPVVRCKDCIYRYDSINCRMFSEGMVTSDYW